MKKIIIQCFLLILIQICSSFDQSENDECTTHVADVKGSCIEAKNCQLFKTERNKLKICSFRNKIPFVCCPSQVPDVKSVGSSGKRVSQTKCDEYAALQNDLKILSERASLNFNIDGSEAAFAAGNLPDFNEFPHMSAIGWKLNEKNIDWLCGGSLISEKFVLSAAHCAIVDGVKPSIIRTGDQDLLTNESNIFPQDFEIKQITVHPQYTAALKYHDLALFELSSSAKFSIDVLPACLASTNVDPVGHTEAMGYGQTSFSGPQSNALLKGFLDIVDNSQCNQEYIDDTTDLPQGITASQICAIDPNGSRDTCQGDSGGPLQVTKFTKSNKKYYEIIGVTSFGKYCAAGAPGVYVKVYSYLDWIENIVWP